MTNQIKEHCPSSNYLIFNQQRLLWPAPNFFSFGMRPASAIRFFTPAIKRRLNTNKLKYTNQSFLNFRQHCISDKKRKKIIIAVVIEIVAVTKTNRFHTIVYLSLINVF